MDTCEFEAEGKKRAVVSSFVDTGRDSAGAAAGQEECFRRIF